MAIFPRTESSVFDMAVTMVNGLGEHTDLFPSVTEDTRTALATAISDLNSARVAKAEAQAAAKNATVAKDQKLDALEEMMRKVLYLAEHDCIGDPSNLEYIGWGDRKPPTPLQKPGNLSGLSPAYEGPGTLTLSWDKPRTGGMVSNYRTERSDQPAGGGIPGPWTLLSTSYTETITLHDQPRGIEMQYRVIATNAAGDSMPSNIATVVL